MLNGVGEGVEVGRWRLQLAADSIAMVLDDGFSVALLVSLREK